MISTEQAFEGLMQDLLTFCKSVKTQIYGKMSIDILVGMHTYRVLK